MWMRSGEKNRAESMIPRKMMKIFAGIIVVVLLGVALPGCGEPESAAPEYADAIAESILQALNSGDYALFSEYFDQQMRETIPENLFQKSRDLIRGESATISPRSSRKHRLSTRFIPSLFTKLNSAKNPPMFR